MCVFVSADIRNLNFFRRIDKSIQIFTPNMRKFSTPPFAVENKELIIVPLAEEDNPLFMNSI